MKVMSRTSLASYSRLAFRAIGVSCVGAACLANTSFAQDTNAPAALPSVTVTGTRLTAAEAEGSLSVTPVDLSQPANTLYPTISDVLRVKLPQYGGADIVNEAYGNGGDGSSSVALRGLPANATLLLVNGRRTSTSDINLIPEAAIDRVEILNDGAGAIYGSDAVAGVVNIILKKEFTGAKFDVRYGNTTEKDVGERSFSALLGDMTEKARIVVSANYSKSSAQLSTDRKRSAPTGDNVSATSNPGTFIQSGDQVALFGTNAYGIANQYFLRWTLNPNTTRGLTNSSQIPGGFNPLATADTSSATTAQEALAIRNAYEASLNTGLPANSPVLYGTSPSLLPGVDPGFPYGVYTYAYRPHERYSTSLSGEYDLFGKNLTLFLDGYYVRNQSENAAAPSPLAGRGLPAGNYWYNRVFTNLNTSDLTVSYRPVELGPRITYTDFESFHGVAGLKGQIAESTWNWEAGFLWDRVTIDDKQTGGVLADVYTALLADPTSSAWNPFGYTPIGGSSVVNSAGTIQSLSGSATSRDLLSTLGVDFHVGGNAFDLPGGPLAVSLGGENRREAEDYEPDYAIQNGSVFPFNTAAPLHATRVVNSFYGETLIPITSEDMNIPLLSSFSVSVAARFEDYSDVGDTGIKPRVSFRWQPVGKEVTLRGSYAEGFSAPSFNDLYQLPGQDFQELYNPLTGSRLQPEEAVLTTGNSGLKPTEASSWLVGAVYSPKWWEDFSVGLNYYKIEQSKIPFQSAQYIVNQWWAAGGQANVNNPFGVNAAPSAANPLGSQVELKSDGELYQVRNVGPINSGKRNTDGIDLFVSKGFKTDVGNFTLAAQFTRTLTFEQEDFPGAGVVTYLDRYFTTGAAMENVGFPEWRGNVTLAYEWKRFSGALAWNYVSGYNEDLSQSNYDPAQVDLRKVSDYQTFDIRAGYLIPKVEVQVMVGVNNLFDATPPLVQSSFENNYDRSIGDIRGRMYFVSASKTF